MGVCLDIEIKAQTSEWKSLEDTRATEARPVLPNVKVLLTIFFNFNVMMHHEARPVLSNVKVLLTIFFNFNVMMHHVFLPQGHRLIENTN